MSAIKRARRERAQAERREKIVTAVLAVRAQLGRDPTWHEMWVAIGGDASIRRSPTVRVLNRFDTRRRSLTQKTKDFRSATGIDARSAGSTGHVTGPNRKRESCNVCHGPLSAYSNGKRYCKPCRNKYERNRAARRNAPLEPSTLAGGRVGDPENRR